MSALFALNTAISINHDSNKNKPATTSAGKFYGTSQYNIRYKWVNVHLMFSAGAVYLRRHVNILREDGVSYSITICVSDPAHSLQGEVCGTLAVTFNSMFVSYLRPVYGKFVLLVSGQDTLSNFFSTFHTRNKTLMQKDLF